MLDQISASYPQASGRPSLGPHLAWIIPLLSLELWQHLGHRVTHMVSLFESRKETLRINLASTTGLYLYVVTVACLFRLPDSSWVAMQDTYICDCTVFY
jgi:hypothetical protein